MSYILNALKKAEQDRLRDDPKDLEDFASARWDPYEQQLSSSKTTIVMMIIAVAILGLVVVIYLGGLKSLNQPNGSVSNSAVSKEIIEEQPVQTLPAAQPDPFAVPTLDISGHMYFAEDSPSNRLFANSQSFKEGDLIANGWILVAIGVDGIEMANKDRSVFVSYP